MDVDLRGGPGIIARTIRQHMREAGTCPYGTFLSLYELQLYGPV